MNQTPIPTLRWGTEIQEVNVLGHPCLIYTDRRTHLAQLLDDGRRFGDREYLVQGNRRFSFAEHERAVCRTAATLQARGVQPGDRVMLLGRNSIEWVVTFWSILHAGGVVVLGNAWWGGAELEHAVRTSSPRFIATDRLRETLDVPNFLVEDLTRNDVGAPEIDMVRREEDEPALVLFTSGTTGRAKGALLSHRGVLATLHSLADRTRRLPDPQTDLAPPSKALLCLPLFHIGGLQQILNPMVAGGTMVFTEGRFDPAQVVDLIRKENIRVWSGVPTMMSRVVQHLEESGQEPLEELRTVGMGAAPVGEQLRRKVLQWFPNSRRGLAVTWGLSEAGGVVTTGAGPEIIERPGTVGRPISTAVITVHDPDEQGVGEIWVRSPSVMLGYLGDDDRDSDETITTNRWLRTGDIGWIDDAGYLYITDRSKDVVIRGGENIATPHVENRLLEHPHVREAAVVGLPHPVLGEELAAIVVIEAGTEVSSDALKTFVSETLAYFEVPSRWWFHEGPLPQNTTGKVLKRQLRDEWSARVVEAALPKELHDAQS